MEYHETKDIHVQQLLGHRDVQNTMVYITIEKRFSRLETGLDYVATFNGKHLVELRCVFSAFSTIVSLMKSDLLYM